MSAIWWRWWRASERPPVEPMPNPFLDPLLARWKSGPAQLMGAFYDGDAWQRLELGAFMHRALQVTAYLRAAGVGPAEIILIILEHGIDAHAAFIGAMLAGAVPSFMPYPNVKQDAELYWRQHRAVFAHIRPRALLVFDSLADAMRDATQGLPVSILNASGIGACTPAEPADVPGGSIALLQHSSGTTGLKKGVKLSYDAIALQLESYARGLRLSDVAEPRIASWLPLYHDMGLISSFLLPVWRGIPILAIDPFEWVAHPGLLLEAIADFRGTHCWVPNFALMHLARMRGARQWDLSSLVALIACSEPCKPEAFDAFQSRFAAMGLRPNVLQTCYAMAETVFAMTQSAIGEPVRRLAVDREALQAAGQVAAPRPGTEPLVLLSNGRPVPGCRVRATGDGGVGEICVTAPFLFSGYHNAPEASAEAFDGGWLRTGDLGFIDDGEVFVVGRIKDVIIVNGKNIFAHDVEAAVSRLPGVKPGRAVAFGSYNQAAGSEQLVVVAERLDDTIAEEALIRTINNVVQLEVSIGCGDVRIVEPGWLVKTTSGKISRSENARRYATLTGASRAPASQPVLLRVTGESD